jgi:hypothetical protein
MRILRVHYLRSLSIVASNFYFSSDPGRRDQNSSAAARRSSSSRISPSSPLCRTCRSVSVEISALAKSTLWNGMEMRRELRGSTRKSLSKGWESTKEGNQKCVASQAQSLSRSLSVFVHQHMAPRQQVDITNITLPALPRKETSTHPLPTKLPDKLPTHPTRARRRGNITRHGQRSHFRHIGPCETCDQIRERAPLCARPHRCRGDFDVGAGEERLRRGGGGGGRGGGNQDGGPDAEIRIRAVGVGFGGDGRGGESAELRGGERVKIGGRSGCGHFREGGGLESWRGRGRWR